MNLMNSVLAALAVLLLVGTGVVLAQPGGGVPGPCYKLNPNGSCGQNLSENPRTLECCGVLFPAWVQTAATTYACEESATGAATTCTDSVEDAAQGTMQLYFGCTGPDNCYPKPWGSPQPYGPKCHSAVLGGTACQ